MDIFSKQPYHEVTVGEIAERAGVGKGTIYSYFNGKEDLFIKMMEYSASVYFQEALAAVRGMTTVREKLGGLLCHNLRFIEKHAAAARILAGERRLPRLGLEAAKDSHQRMEKLISELLQQGIESGEFRTVDVAAVTLVIMGTFSAMWAAALFAAHAPEDTEIIVEKILDFYLYGLASR